MPSKPTIRYGHTEGQTEICFDDSGEYLVSCGRDGEVRIWKGIDDDDPSIITVGETAYSIVVKGNVLYVAPDNNSVDRFAFPSGQQDGILARFTGNVTHLAVSESKKYVAAGSSDFDIKVIHPETKKQKCFLGHQAPILSVAIDPNDEYLASTSCDGKLKIWNLKSEECIETIDVVTPSNDVGNSESLARICWRPATGEDIAVPTGNDVKIYSRVTWSLFQSLKTTATNKTFQCCSFSPCGRFLAAASVDGWIVVWDAETQSCARKIQHHLQTCISSIAWNPKENNSLAFSDIRGQLGVLEDVVPSEEPTKTKTADDLDALFEEEDDNMMLDLMAEEDKHAQIDDDGIPSMKRKSKVTLFDSDDEDEPPNNQASQNSDLPQIPSTMEVLGRDDLDMDLAPPSIPPTAPMKLIEDDDSSIATGAAPARIPAISMQRPFQPGSTPIHLSHRFMVWNSIGLIRCYSDDTENAIDVEFHDAQTHHPLHVSNHENYTMADLSDKAVVVAAESNDDAPSKVKCIHFSSWDNNKEWTLNMPDGEEIQSIAVGDGWVAVCTDALQVRLLSLGGTQRQIFSLPGQVVAMATHTDQLLIVYHVTQGFGRSQCLGFMLLEVGCGSGCKPRKIIGGQPFPISPDSTLSWLGFTAEGTPGAVDSTGVVRLLNREFCQTWTQVANLNKSTKSRHDHYWVVGLHENPQQIRCVLCKGAVYPSTLPRPTVAIQQYSLPLCEMNNEKSKLEEEYWRARLFSKYGDYLTSRGYEADPTSQHKSNLEIQHVLMKLFALCCKSDQEFQASEVSSLMPTHAAVQLAIKYASRMRRIILAQRLQEVAQEKLEEEQQVESGVEEDEEDFKVDIQSGYSTTETEWSKRHSQSNVPKPTQPCNDDESDEGAEVSSQNTVEKERRAKPVRSLSSQLAGTRKNPFKKSANASSKPSDSEASSSGSVLDGIKRPTPTTMRRAPITSSEITKKLKGKDQKKPKATQATLKMSYLTSTPKGKKTGGPEAAGGEPKVLTESNSTNAKKPVSGVHLFIEENLSSVKEDNPGLDGIECRKILIKRFRSLSPDEKQEWGNRVHSPSLAPSGGPKRTLDEAADDDVIENNPPCSEELTNQNPAKVMKLEDENHSNFNPKSKLSAFAFEPDT